MMRLARDLDWQRGVELGVGSGQLYARLRSLGIDLVGVDLGQRADRKAKVERLGGIIHWMSTHDAATLVPDGWADFVFVDASHSYEAVKDDIAQWERKVKRGGWFGGHDYHVRFPGVIRAVNEVFPKIELLPGWVWVRA
jgi:SAM-dependent methyltransferase